MKKLLLGLIALCMLACQSKVALEPIKPGEIWPDNEGVHINAHGGGVLFHEGTYYWFGENKCDTTCNAMVKIVFLDIRIKLKLNNMLIYRTNQKYHTLY